MFLWINFAESFDFTGRYKLVKSDNYNEFLIAIGIPYYKRSVALRLKPEQVISKADDGTYSLRTITQLYDNEVKFRDGVQTKWERPDGEITTSVVNINDKKWLEKQLGRTTINVERDFNQDGMMTVKLTGNGVTTTRTYKKI